jgi:peptidoglycan/LPS O-acetylase OafA/YrhL
VRSPQLPFPRQIRALDGVRALAVVAVLGFHGGLPVVPGGFLGVDAFFALSGFLITSLLLGEWRADGRIRLAAFWARRARRLLPALLLLLVALGIAHALVAMPDAYPGFRGDALATLLYVANWHLILEGSNYFSQSGLSPLTHTWSLAIEEQFYLVWPFVVLGVLRISRTLLPLAVVCVAGALASAAEMALLFRAGTDTSRLYYGTDTHAQCLLVGATLAVALTAWATGRGSWEVGGRAGRALIGPVGWAGVVVTAVLWVRASGTTPFIYEGGFLAAAAATTAILLAVVTVPGGALAKVLSVAPLRALGRISYGVYLWHLPLFLLLDGARTGLTGYPLFGLRFAVTIAVASGSYLLVELPIRQRVALRSWRGWLVGPVALAAAAGAIVLTTASPVATFADATALPPAVPVAVPVPAPSTAAAGSGPARGDGSSAIATRGTGPLVGAAPVRVLVVGDSLAGTLAAGLGSVAAGYDVQIFDDGSPGCSVSMDDDFELAGTQFPPGLPCQAGDPAALFAAWRTWVQQDDPDVVVYLARGETFDQDVNGEWSNITDPAFAAWTADRLRQGVGILSARGAHVVLMTLPYFDSGEQPSGTPFPEDDPARARLVNDVLRSVARSDPGSVSLFNLGALVSPGDAYAPVVAGVDVRCADGVHFTLAGGEWLAGRLLPTLVELGALHHDATPAAPGGSGVPPPVVPPWMAKLSCGVA